MPRPQVTNHDAFYDCDMARLDFTENIVSASRSRDDRIYFYAEHASKPSDARMEFIDQLYDFEDVSQQDLLKVLLEATKGMYEESFEGFREFLRENSCYGCFREGFIDHLREENDIFQYANGKNTIADDVGAKRKYKIFETHGYSQGDWATVLVNKADWEAYTGLQLTGDHVQNLQEHINHLFWDAPVYARLEVINEQGQQDEIHLEEYLSDRYRWDKDDLLKNAKNLPKYILSYIESVMPDEIQYSW